MHESAGIGGTSGSPSWLNPFRPRCVCCQFPAQPRRNSSTNVCLDAGESIPGSTKLRGER